MEQERWIDRKVDGSDETQLKDTDSEKINIRYFCMNVYYGAHYRLHAIYGCNISERFWSGVGLCTNR